MSLAEMLLIVVVALLVLGPDKFPVLIRHCVQIRKKIDLWREQWHAYWLEQDKQQTLKKNEARAETVDVEYQRLNDKHPS